MRGPDLEVVAVLRTRAWRWVGIDETHAAVDPARWPRRAVRRAAERLERAGYIDRTALGYRWAAGPDADGRLAEVAAAVGVDLPPVARPPDDCPACGDPLDHDHRARTGFVGCRRCGELV